MTFMKRSLVAIRTPTGANRLPNPDRWRATIDGQRRANILAELIEHFEELIKNPNQARSLPPAYEALLAELSDYGLYKSSHPKKAAAYLSDSERYVLELRTQLELIKINAEQKQLHEEQANVIRMNAHLGELAAKAAILLGGVMLGADAFMQFAGIGELANGTILGSLLVLSGIGGVIINRIIGTAYRDSGTSPKDAEKK